MCYRCCKGCQTIWESLYWHCFEKRWCYDEEIALYEEPGMASEEKNSDYAFDNMAFYDSVAVIAGRNIVTIQPLSNESIERKKSEVKLPTNVHWVDENQQQKNGGPKAPQKPANVLPIIRQLRAAESSSNLSAENASNSQSKAQIDTVDKGMLSPEEAYMNKNRRPSLQQRRMSKILTLRLDSNAELPIIRQNSMPKFYLDTPEPNEYDSSILRTPSLALTSPVVPQVSAFDLRSVVHHETQSKLQHTVSQASRIAQIRDKFKKPLLLRRQASNASIPNSINHM